MRIQRTTDSVDILDIEALPGILKDAVVTMPALVWRALLDSVGIEDRALYEDCVKRIEFKPDKRAIAAELKSGAEVFGAQLKPRSEERRGGRGGQVRCTG